jgi:FlaA1/EpsC-like NDP-sugar epimerase
MTRFSITMQKGIEMVELALQHSEGGEIYVPKAPSYKITNVAEAIAPECKQKVVGIRPGEKVSELMVSRFEGMRAIENKNHYVILPEDSLSGIQQYAERKKGEVVAPGFEYDSATNTNWLEVADLKSQILKLNL